MRPLHRSSITTALVVLLSSASVSLAPLPALARFSFTPLGDLPGGGFQSYATGLSDAGDVAVGWSNSADSPRQGFVWTAAQGLVNVGALPGGSNAYSEIEAISGDGNVIYGRSNSSLGTVPAVGDREGNLARFDPNPGGTTQMPAGTFGNTYPGISGDGSAVLGRWKLGGESSYQYYLWTAATGAQPIAGFPGTPAASDISLWDLSSDGLTAVGSITDENGVLHAATWSAASGVTLLGGSGERTFARAISSDGTAIAGGARDAGVGEAVLWTQRGMARLGELPGGENYSIAWDSSDGGSIVVGRSSDASGDVAFIWRDGYGMMALEEYLVLNGLDLAGWTLDDAIAISSDGHTILGNGTNPSGFMEAFVVTIPEPSTGALVALGLGVLTSRRCARGELRGSSS